MNFWDYCCIFDSINKLYFQILRKKEKKVKLSSRCGTGGNGNASGAGGGAT